MPSNRGHINQALTNYSQGIAKALDQAYIADLVAPPVSVPNMSDGYWVMGDDSLRPSDNTIGQTADVPRVRFAWSDDTYNTKEFGLETVISKSKLANADSAMRYQQTHATGIVRKMKLGLEVQVAAKLFNTGVMTNTAALAAADRWDVDTSDPVGKSLAAREAIRALIGVEPNKLVLGAHVAAHLALHPAVTSRLAGLVAGTPATLAQIATVMGVDEVVVGKAVYVSSLEGAASKTKADIWGKYAAFAYIDASPDPTEGTICPIQRFRYTGFMPEFGTYEYDEGALKHILGVYACYDLKTITADACYLYSTVVS